jgi:NAD-dependent SIR2 family protein deacetylase
VNLTGGSCLGCTRSVINENYMECGEARVPVCPNCQGILRVRDSELREALKAVLRFHNKRMLLGAMATVTMTDGCLTITRRMPVFECPRIGTQYSGHFDPTGSDDK